MPRKKKETPKIMVVLPEQVAKFKLLWERGEHTKARDYLDEFCKPSYAASIALMAGLTDKDANILYPYSNVRNPDNINDYIQKELEKKKEPSLLDGCEHVGQEKVGESIGSATA